MSKEAGLLRRWLLHALLVFLCAAGTRAYALNINNQASASFLDSVGGQPRTLTSNQVSVVTSPPPPPPVLRFYSSGSFAAPAIVARPGTDLFLQADAPGCNLSDTTVESQELLLQALPSDDLERFIAVETAPNSGIFRISVPTANSATALRGNATVEVSENGTVSATLEGCGSSSTLSQLLIDPLGVVFDTRTNTPVANASVELVIANAGVCSSTRANVLQISASNPDQLEVAPNPVTTGTDGRFQFQLVTQGSYCLRVTTPPGFDNPSLVSAQTLRATPLTAARRIDGSGTTGGSYGGAFDITLVTGPVSIDYPVDSALPPPTGSLLLRKTALTATVELGEFVDYRVSVKNQTGTLISNARIIDVLPAGFAYEPGTARFGNARIAEPSGARGARVSFALPDLPADAQELSLTYRVRVGPGASAGDATNRAQAVGTAGSTAVSSNVGAAKVNILGGVFSDRGFIVGKVFLDCNRNRIQDSEELGIPGVRLFMEDGSFVLSDAEGKYSFYGVSPRTHVLKIDNTTMPAGSELINLSNRNAGDAQSRFVDLKKGELHKANFAEGSCNKRVIAEVKARRTRAETLVAEVERELKAKVTADGKPEPIGDVKALPATGVIGGPERQQQPVEFFTGVRPITQYDKDYTGAPRGPVAPFAPRSGALPGPLVDLEKVLAGADNTLAFLDLKDKDTLPYPQTTVRVKGADSVQIKLRVNDAEVSEKRVGKQTTMPERKLQGKEYIGVTLRPGSNKLEALQYDQFGNERGRAVITLIAPDRLGKLQIELPKSDAIADGVTPVKFTLRLTDAAGVPVTVRTPITIEASLGRLDIDDFGKVEPGVQTFIEGGSGQFILLPPQEAGEALLRVTSGTLNAETRLYFLPDLRPMIAAGVVEGVLNLRKLNSKALVPARQQDAFDQELRQFAREGNGGKRSAAARAALFLKGKVKGEYLLTIGYDSDKETRERLFRDIQPDQFYPVYGDSSIKGFDAQSTGKLYVRVDKQRSYLLYGDFTTQASVEARKLSNYSRSLTGIKEHYETGRASINAFASRDSTRQVVDEVRANGTSGPYQLSGADGLVNSEKVEIITRDRNQPAVILASVPQTRFSDYEIDFEPTGGRMRILFKAPVPSLDPNLNPIAIRVTYEVDQGGPQFWVGGVDAQVKLNERVEIGGVAVMDRNPQDEKTLVGVNATVRIGDKTYLMGEFARSDAQVLGKGDAARLELKHEGDKLKAEAFVGRTDEAFDNPGAWLTRGRSESGLKGAYQLNEKTRLLGEAIRTEDRAINGERDGILLSLERTLNDHLRVEIGARHSRESVQPAQPSSVGATPNDVDSVRLKVSGTLPSLPKATVFAEIEQDVKDSDKRVLALGGEYQIADRARAYARHEFISTINGPFALNNNQRQNTTVFGLDTDYMKDGHLFSEYRMRDAISGREAEAAIGLRNLWDLGEGLRLNTNFERIHPVAGGDTNKSTALAIGLDYIGADWWKGSARLELRDGSTSDSMLNTLGAAIKLDQNWTFLGRNILSITQESTGDRVQERLQLGMAYRDTDTDVWNALGKIEVRHEKDGTQPGIKLRRATQIISLHGNYQLSKPMILSGRAASKFVQDRSNGLDSKYNAHLVSGRMIFEISKRWDLSMQASSHFSNSFKTHQYGLGLELGYLVTENLWLAGGYNLFGFEDEDLADGDYTNPGWYARLRFKFDESLFGANDPRINSTLSKRKNSVE